VFADTEAKVARLGEVSLLQFVFLDFQTTLQNFFGFRATDGDMDSDLLVTTDAECSDGVAGLAWRNDMSELSSTRFRSEPLQSLQTLIRILTYCRLEFDHLIVPTPLQHE
jgi:hypothetical protein